MSKSLVALLTAAPAFLLATSAFGADPQVTAERRALKPQATLTVVDTTIRVSIKEGRKRNAKGFTEKTGWQPSRISFDLWGKSDDANAMVVTWRDGKKVLGTTTCSAPKLTDTFSKENGHWNDQEQVDCDVKEESMNIAGGGTYQADIAYREAGKPDQPLRTVTFNVRSVAETNHKDSDPFYFVDHDFKLAEAVAYWNWDADELVLRTFSKQGSDFKEVQGKLKCTLNGTALSEDGDLYSSDSYYVTDAAKDERIRWVEHKGVLRHPRDKGFFKPGKYECKMVHQAKVLRTIRFELDAKLGIVTGAEQESSKAGAFVSRTTLLRDFDIPAGVDLPFDRKAVEGKPFYGRAWLTGPIKLAAGVGGDYVAPNFKMAKGGKAKNGPKKAAAVKRKRK